MVMSGGVRSWKADRHMVLGEGEGDGKSGVVAEAVTGKATEDVGEDGVVAEVVAVVVAEGDGEEIPMTTSGVKDLRSINIRHIPAIPQWTSTTHGNHGHCRLHRLLLRVSLGSTQMGAR